MLKNRKTESFYLEGGASAVADDMKKEDVVNEIKPTAASILREERRATMSKLVKEMAFCALWTTWSSEVGVEVRAWWQKNLNGTVDFVHAFPP